MVKQIASGHAFSSHVAEFEDLGVKTEDDFASHINKVVSRPSVVRQLGDGRSAYWDDASGTVVIRNPHDPDGGTAFRPSTGKKYFDDLR